VQFGIGEELLLVSGYGDDDCGGVVFDFRFSLKIVHF